MVLRWIMKAEASLLAYYVVDLFLLSVSDLLKIQAVYLDCYSLNLEALT